MIARQVQFFTSKLFGRAERSGMQGEFTMELFHAQLDLLRGYCKRQLSRESGGMWAWVERGSFEDQRCSRRHCAASACPFATVTGSSSLTSLLRVAQLESFDSFR